MAYRNAILVGILLTAFGASHAQAQDDSRLRALTEKVASLEKALEGVEALRVELTSLRTEIRELRGAGKPQPTDKLRTAPETAQQFQEKKVAPNFGGQYTKPFLTRLGRDTYLGGYADVVFKSRQNHDNFINQERLVPFIYSDVSDRVRFASEIELEDGGPDSPGGGEISAEFAQIDFTFSEAVNLRGGILLSPLGKLNLVHDSPLQDLTERPLVDRFVIPTTLSEPGFGFFGTVAPGAESQLTYEAYVVDGFVGLRDDGTAEISRTRGLRDAREGGESVINNHLSTVARVAYSPFLGLEFGLSSHNGKYDENADDWLSISAFDFAWQKGAFEFLGEAAYAHIHRDDFARASGIPGDFWGYYLQANYHFLPGFLHDALPKIFTDDSTFTLVGRWDHDDLDGRELSRATVGLNFRYTEDTVIKFDYQFNTGWGEHTIDEDDDDAFLFSIATYF